MQNEKSIYLSYYKLPKKIFVNEVFPVTIKIIITEDNYKSLSFNFEKDENILPIYTEEPFINDGTYIYKTFYFKALSKDIRLPDFIFYLLIDEYSPIKKEILYGKRLNAIKLRPPKDFCNVLAKDLKIKNFQSVQYDKEQNIILLNLEANLSNLEDFHLSFVNKEGIEELNNTFPISKMTYYAIIPNSLKKFTFSYFNTKKNRFERLSNKIVVKDEIVSTQTDINPNEASYNNIKFLIISSIGVIFLIITIFKKSILSLLITIFLFGYVAYILIPLEKVCIKQNSNIRLLPTKNSTIFYITKYRFKTEKLKKVNGFIKIKLPNNKIGWVKDEDICKD